MPNGHSDPNYPPDLPETGECVAEHNRAVDKYNDMKKAESDAVNAAKKARDRAGAALVACAVGQAGGPWVGAAACVAGVGATIDAVNDLKAKNDLFVIAIRIYDQEKQTLSDCINNSGIVIELD